MRVVGVFVGALVEGAEVDGVIGQEKGAFVVTVTHVSVSQIVPFAFNLVRLDNNVSFAQVPVPL